jgi:hypothetical protein
MEWVALVLSSASMRIILNGVPGQCICHEKGLRQGDPLSPLLFILAMEVLNALFTCVDDQGLLMSLCASAIRFRVSLYADDLVVFLALQETDVWLARTIMEFFADASGLRTNAAKCQVAPIWCSEDQIALVQHWFPYQVIVFPFRYLRVPLSTHMLKKDEFLPLVDEVADRLLGWKSGLMSKVGHNALVKSTLMAPTVHIAITVCVPPWII